MITAATRVLDRLGITYQIFEHKLPVRSLEQAAQERGQQPNQVVRSLLFRSGEGGFVMVLVAGGEQVSWQILRTYLGVRRLTTATPEEVLSITGYLPGTVAPLGLLTRVRILVDESVLRQEDISMGSGRRGTAILLKSKNLLEALELYELGKFTSTGNAADNCVK